MYSSVQFIDSHMHAAIARTHTEGMDSEAADLRHRNTVVEGVVDHRGRPASRLASGRWTSAFFIIGVEIAERSAYYGISSNLISYLAGPLQEPTASAAAAVNAWSGVASVLPLLGAFVADSYLSRYRTIVAASVLYLLGLGMLTLSTALPTLYPPECNSSSTGFAACAPTKLQLVIFYFSLYLVAFAQAGHKPCVQAFGADQFDEKDAEECKSKSSFFNWWYFSLCGGTTTVTACLNYIQDNISWVIGFGIPFVFLALALVIFLLGTRTYRFYVLLDDKNPFSEIYKAFIALIKESQTPAAAPDEEASQALLGKAPDLTKLSNVATEEAKGLLRLFPIWATSLSFAVVLAQSSTFFIKQGSTLDRRIGSKFQVPPASLQSFIGISIVAFVPVYDRVIVPFTGKFSGNPKGITMLQRIGTGMALSAITMVIAALVEMKRLKTARDLGLVDSPEATIPMSMWWLLPQYILYGVANVFAMVGLQEFFYDQVPDALRSLGLALYLSIFGIGEFISGFMVSAIDVVTRRQRESWFSNNLNHAHLDYFYLLLAGLSAIQFVIYIYSAQSYVYKKKANIVV